MSRASVSTAGFGLQCLIIWLAMLGVSTYDFQPFLVGGLISERGLTASQAGLVMAANMGGVCVALTLATIRVQRWSRPRLFATAMILIILANIGSVFATSMAGVTLLRFIVGLGEGLALAIAVAAVTLVAKPDRLFALIMVGMSFYGMVGLLLMPTLIDRFGLNAVYLGVAAFSIVTLPAFRAIPDVDSDDAHALTASSMPMNLPIILLLVCILVLYLATNGVWAYYERIGVVMNISAADIGLVLSAGLAASMVGGLVAAVLSDRFGRFGPVTLGIGASVIGIAILLFASGFTPYLMSVALLFGGTGFTVPFVMGQLTAFDPAGRVSIAGFLTVSVGNFIGPAVAASVVGADSFHRLLTLAALIGTLSLMLGVVAFVLIRRRPRLGAPI